MKLKYYLRGLGIGVIVTTIILAIALGRKPEAMTDAQIKERAAELGMVEKELVKEKQNVSGEAIKPATDDGIAAGQDMTQAPAPTTEAPTTTKPPETTTKAPETTKATTAPTTKATQAPVHEETEEGTYVTIEIGATDWSNHVASKLAAAGLVESAADFDQYLINNGYEAIIASGTHRFKVGSSYAELARELVN